MMRKTTKTVLLLSSMGLMIACGNNKKTENTMSENTNVDKGIALAEMDTTVRPQDDFYNYVLWRIVGRQVLKTCPQAAQTAPKPSFISLWIK